MLILALRNTFCILRRTKELCSILEANMADDEYERAYEEYEEGNSIMRQIRKLTSDGIAIEAKILLRVLGQELGSEEIAEMLNLDVLEVERTLQNYKKERRTKRNNI